MQKNIKRLRHSGIKLASSPSHKVYLSHIWWLSLAIHNFCIFVGYAWRFGFVQFNNWQFIPRYFLIHWLILDSRRFSITYEVHKLPAQVEMHDTFYMQLLAYILYEFCIQIIYIVLMICTTFVNQNWRMQNVHKIYTKYITHFDKLLYTFYIQNIYKSLLKCGIYFVYKHLAYILHTSNPKCMHDFCVVTMLKLLLCKYALFSL